MDSIRGDFLSNVHVDISELIQSSQNIKCAIVSIETTKMAITKKHQQLGCDWKDKKYRELGDIIKECTKALNDILKSLQKGEKFIDLLVENLHDYEDVQFISNGSERTSNGFIESLRANIQSKRKSDSEKLKDLKEGLSIIDERIDNYANSLESRGLQRGVVMNAILTHQRNLEQAELLRNINGDFSNPVLPPNFDEIIERCQSNGMIDYHSAEMQVRSLSQTRYGFSDQVINGTEMRVYNDPIGTNSLLIHQQGGSNYDMEGTCGLCQCANLLTMAGVMNSSEDSVISAAMHSSDDVLECMELFNNDVSERGGTTTNGRREILSRCGLSTYNLPVSFNRQQTTQRLSEEIRTGHGVIVSVDVARLWRNGQSGGHAISLISVSEDGSTFIYNDTGRGVMGTISADDLGDALTGRPANITSNIIR